ncbi:MAG: hypothetical protein GY856_52665 [bacterium]|nr:hypothetical protein [bacterium]
MTPNQVRFQSLLFATLILSLAAALPAGAQCLADAPPLGIFFMDLRLAFSIDLTGGAVTVLSPPQNNNECADGSQMAVLEIDIPDECTQANILVEYEGEPEGWSLGLGDSPTNNGFGGDSGTTPNNAELQILEQQLAVYNAASVPEEVDRLVIQDLALTDGAIRLTVGDQAVGWGQPRAALQTSGLNRLFAIPDLDSADGSSVYLGLNRVVLNDSRRGCGVRRVLVSFE